VFRPSCISVSVGGRLIKTSGIGICVTKKGFWFYIKSLLSPALSSKGGEGAAHHEVERDERLGRKGARELRSLLPMRGVAGYTLAAQ
jgi:hypothetical protein